MCNQINIRLDPTTKAWLIREAQKANVPVATFAKLIIQRAVAEEQKTIDFEAIAELAAEAVAVKINKKLDELVE